MMLLCNSANMRMTACFAKGQTTKGASRGFDPDRITRFNDTALQHGSVSADTRLIVAHRGL